MAIKWLCTGKSVHIYNNENGGLPNRVSAIDFKAEIDTESEAGSVNELFATKPVLTEAGVTAFVGLQVYPQGFTVYMDDRLISTPVQGVIKIGTKTAGVMDFVQAQLGFPLNLTESGDDGGDGGDGGDIH